MQSSRYSGAWRHETPVKMYWCLLRKGWRNGGGLPMMLCFKLYYYQPLLTWPPISRSMSRCDLLQPPKQSQKTKSLQKEDNPNYHKNFITMGSWNDKKQMPVKRLTLKNVKDWNVSCYKLATLRTYSDVLQTGKCETLRIMGTLSSPHSFPGTFLRCPKRYSRMCLMPIKTGFSWLQWSRGHINW